MVRFVLIILVFFAFRSVFATDPMPLNSYTCSEKDTGKHILDVTIGPTMSSIQIYGFAIKSMLVDRRKDGSIAISGTMDRPGNRCSGDCGEYHYVFFLEKRAEDSSLNVVNRRYDEGERKHKVRIIWLKLDCR